MAKKYDKPAVLPKKAEPKVVGEFIGKHLKGMPETARQVGRLATLARFYDIRGCAPQVAEKLNKQEQDDKEWMRGVVLAGFLADMGDAKQQAQAGEYAKYLAGKPPAGEGVDQLVGLYFSLPKGTDPKFITDLAAAEVKKAPPGDEGMVKKANLESQLAVLPRVELARKRKFEILDMKDAKQQITALANVYLELEVFPLTPMQGWSVMMLQRICNDGSPADLAAVFGPMVAGMLGEAGVKSPSGGKVPEDQEKGFITRCVRAYEFYEGKLVGAQREAFMKKKGGYRSQDDVLWWDEDPKS